MDKITFQKLLACPVCKNKLVIKKDKGFCKKCFLEYKNKKGIWDLLYIKEGLSRKSATGYEKMHSVDVVGPDDGSYEILSSIARGNRTVDIGSGQGHIAKMAKNTVSVDFSFNALKRARAYKVKNLVMADAQNLPFVDDAFDVSISAGTLEHVLNPKQAILEMARVSKIQVLTIHREFNIPFAGNIRSLTSKAMGITHQPIEKPITMPELEKMFDAAKLKIIFKGYWTLPVNFGRITKNIPVLKNTPSCFFIISIKK